MSDEPHPNFRPPESLPAELRDAQVSAAARRWLSRTLRRTVKTVRPLAGASSSAVHVVAFDSGEGVVVKRYLWPGFLDEEPIAPRREVAALRFARANGLAVPDVLATDLDGAAVGDHVPTIVMSLIDGRARRTPDVHALAEVAAAIHDVPAAAFQHEWFAWFEDRDHEPPPLATRPELWERALEIWRDARPDFEPVFIHRDFHPGNLLWSGDALTGIVDWANACRGPRDCDVAHCRDNLIRLSGHAAAHAFTRAYENVTGHSFDPYWEIASVLEHDLDTMRAADVAHSEARLAPALAQR